LPGVSSRLANARRQERATSGMSGRWSSGVFTYRYAVA
jgi:hypothetical protein